MINFYCDLCGSTLIEDGRLTAINYDKDIVGIINSDGIIDYSIVPDYIVYSCFKCNFSKKVNIKDIIKLKQQFFIDHILLMRLQRSTSLSKRSVLDETKGISYCGICKGPFDGDGFCPNGWQEVCITRREISGR